MFCLDYYDEWQLQPMQGSIRVEMKKSDEPDLNQPKYDVDANMPQVEITLRKSQLTGKVTPLLFVSVLWFNILYVDVGVVVADLFGILSVASSRALKRRYRHAWTIAQDGDYTAPQRRWIYVREIVTKVCWIITPFHQKKKIIVHSSIVASTRESWPISLGKH